MVKLHFLWLCWGPVLSGFSLGWLIRHPDDWTGPAILGPVGLVYGGVTYYLAWRLLKRTPDRVPLIAAMVGAALLGVALFGMLVFDVLT